MSSPFALSAVRGSYGNGMSGQHDLLTTGTQSQVFAYSDVLSKPIQGSPVEIENRVVSNLASLFVDFPADLRPSATSVLRDSGNPDLLPGLGNLDHAGTPRVQNGRVDVGAFEFESLFSDGFES